MPRLIWVFAGRTCHLVGFVVQWLSKWASPCEKVTYNIVEQRRLRRVYTSTQSRQSHCCSLTKYMGLEEASDKSLISDSFWVDMRLEDLKPHNAKLHFLMRWLKKSLISEVMWHFMFLYAMKIYLFISALSSNDTCLHSPLFIWKPVENPEFDNWEMIWNL